MPVHTRARTESLDSSDETESIEIDSDNAEEIIGISFYQNELK